MQTNRSLPNPGRLALFILFALLLVMGGEAAANAATSVEAAHRAQLFQWKPFLAPFHAVVLHFPIGFFTLAVLLEIYRWRRPSPEIRQVTVFVLWLSLVAGIVTALLGTMRAGTGGYQSSSLAIHRVYGLAVPVFTFITLLAQRIAFRPANSRGWMFGYRTFLVGTMGLILIAGHLGGNLTHGSKYLTENAPAFVKELMEEPQPTPAGTNDLSAAQRQYVEKVLPAFEAKCLRCHGPEKQKGDYRLDRAEVARKGGESGRTAIKPGEPMESHLVKLILLPRDDDNAMPPDGKEPLTAEETMAVIEWIQKGAEFSANEQAQSIASHSP